jgi:hypothetical protein
MDWKSLTITYQTQQDGSNVAFRVVMPSDPVSSYHHYSKMLVTHPQDYTVPQNRKPQPQLQHCKNLKSQTKGRNFSIFHINGHKKHETDLRTI